MFENGNLSAWAQAIIAFITLLIAFASLVQSKKIRELTDVADALIEQNKELGKQTKELQRHTTELEKQVNITENRYQIEKTVSLPQRIPVFQADHAEHNEFQKFWLIQLLNVGVDAINISLDCPEDLFINIENETSVKHRTTLTIKFFYKDLVVLGSSFQFVLSFTNHYKHKSYQFVSKEQGTYDFHIDAPSEPVIVTSGLIPDYRPKNIF